MPITDKLTHDIHATSASIVIEAMNNSEEWIELDSYETNPRATITEGAKNRILNGFILVELVFKVLSSLFALTI